MQIALEEHIEYINAEAQTVNASVEFAAYQFIFVRHGYSIFNDLEATIES